MFCLTGDWSRVEFISRIQADLVLDEAWWTSREKPDVKSMIEDIFDAVRDALCRTPTDEEFMEEVTKQLDYYEV
ncbi:hypothetical protein Tco_0281213 [Tanacetum coccineum]